MTVTQWSVNLVCVNYHPRGQKGRSLVYKRYFSRAIRPSSLGPRTVGISQGKQFSRPPTSPVTRHRTVRLHLVMWARLSRPTFAEQWKSCRLNVLPQLIFLDQIKHATCVAKFIQYMYLVLLRILQQTSATSSRVSVP